MDTNPVSIIELQNARIFFDGAACLVRDSDNVIVYRFGLTDEQCESLSKADYPLLPGLTHLLGASAGAHCYYHWMVDILPRLGILQKSGVSVSQLDHVLVRETHQPFQSETLAQLGIQENQIIETRNNAFFTCEKLLHVHLDNGINMKMNRFIPAWLQYQFGERNLCNERKRIYISRPAGVRRGIANEKELLPLLESRGFHIDTMEDKTVKQQAELLAGCDVLISPHGGALTNMLFCQPGSRIVELFGRHVYPFYYGLAQSCCHEYHAVFENTADFKRITQFSTASAFGSSKFQKLTRDKAFTVDPQLLSAVLNSL
ncbi:MAG: DUF563 domain-containing protein [Granulosicoccus sp.]